MFGYKLQKLHVFLNIKALKKFFINVYTKKLKPREKKFKCNVFFCNRAQKPLKIRDFAVTKTVTKL